MFSAALDHMFDKLKWPKDKPAVPWAERREIGVVADHDQRVGRDGQVKDQIFLEVS